jgi:multiple sugar transport system permease protein
VHDRTKSRAGRLSSFRPSPRFTSAAVFVGPAVVFLGLVLVYPIAYSIWTSLHIYNLAELYLGEPFVGLQNYAQALSDPYFYHGILVSIIITLGNLLIELPLGFLLALAINRRFRGASFFRVLFTLPVLLTPVAVALTWRFMFQYTGIWNYLLSLIHLGPLDWSSTTLGLLQIIIVVAWENTAFAFIVFLAGLQTMPSEIVDAAQTDGAGSLQLLRRITLPMMRPFIFLVLLIRLMDLLRLFDEGFILTGGGPARSTETLSMLNYTNMFTFGDIGYGSALSTLQLLIILAFMFAYQRFVGWRAVD